jgi:hypothetical protein
MTYAVGSIASLRCDGKPDRKVPTKWQRTLSSARLKPKTPFNSEHLSKLISGSKSLKMWSKWSGTRPARFLAFVDFEKVTTFLRQAPDALACYLAQVLPPAAGPHSVRLPTST